ncbi:MAG: hypothetical protein ACPGYV_11555 [Phycisphaeraceae bacterium]
MLASFVDLRKKSAEIIRALRRNERITVLYRGKPTAVMHPIDEPDASPVSARDHQAFGIWRDHPVQTDPAEHVRRIRRGRFDAL